MYYVYVIECETELTVALIYAALGVEWSSVVIHLGILHSPAQFKVELLCCNSDTS